MDALHYAKQLVQFDTISSKSNVDISDYIQDVLAKFGFRIERLEYDDEFGVRKACVVAKRGAGLGGMAYFAHTDVVPADDWSMADNGPFEPTVHGDRLYGRGSCDMKGSLACALAAAERHANDDLANPLYITCTSDEEIGYGGAKNVAARSELYREMADGGSRVVIGEPTMLDVVHAHKGTYGFRAVSRGQSAHSSTPYGCNANLAMIPFLVEMKRIHDEAESNVEWQNAEFTPPSISWNIGVNDHTAAINIKPPNSICTVYYRPMPGQDGRKFFELAEQAATECGIEIELQRACDALYTDPNSDYVREILALAERESSRTVAYGTDGGVFTDLDNIVVIGPGSIEQAHTADEWIAVEQLELGEELYAKLIEAWCVRDDVGDDVRDDVGGGA